MNGGRESRETESAGETEEEMEEEPVVSERNEIQNQTASTIQQVHGVLAYPSPYP